MFCKKEEIEFVICDINIEVKVVDLFVLLIYYMNNNIIN